MRPFPQRCFFGPAHFNSRTSCEVRHDTVKICRIPKEFQLTHLLRGATQNALKICCAGKFQLTHLLRGATCDIKRICRVAGFQLTHLLRGATKFSYVFGATNNFNSRTSCEVRHLPQCCILDDWQFQLTHLLRGATNIGWISEKYLEISTHAPLARCDAVQQRVSLRLRISTHAPLARCDLQR